MAELQMIFYLVCQDQLWFLEALYVRRGLDGVEKTLIRDQFGGTKQQM